MRPDLRQYPITRQNRNPPPAPMESDADPTNGQQRRRIAVACGRCRKRKIRCSGDPGDNTGCHNCRAAGAEIGQCKFFRVGSYTPMGPMIPPFLTYHHGVASNPNLSLGSPVHAHAGAYPSHDRAVITRPYQPAYGPVGYGDDSSLESFTFPTPASPAGNDIFAPFYGSQDSFKSWSAADQKPAMTNNTLYLDQNQSAPSSSASTSAANTPTTRQPAVTTDGTSVFSMYSLQSSLFPTTTQSSLPSSLETRHLPMPTATRTPSVQTQIELPIRTLTSSTAPNGNNIHVNGTYTKAAMVWNPENTTPDDRQSVSKVSSSEMVAVPATKGPTSSPDPEPAIDGFVPINANPNNALSGASSSQYTTSSTVYHTPSTITMDEKFPVTPTPPPQNSRGEVLAPRTSSESSLYSYATTGSGNCKDSDPQASQAGTLVSGQRYTPLSQPQPLHSANIDALRRNSFEGRSTSKIARL